MSDNVTGGSSFNDFVTCPLNKAHRVLNGRLAKHLVRCARNHEQKTGKFLICPFNPTHRFIAAEMEDHKKVCENRVDLDLFTDEVKPSSSVDQSQVQALPPIQVVECEDDWDLEPDVGTYNPLHHCEQNLIVRSLNGYSRAVRNEFRRNERRRFAEMKNQQ